MTKHLFWICILLIQSNAFSQDFEGTTALRSQAEVDQFGLDHPNSFYPYSIGIYGTDIKNLNSIAHISSIGGSLEIRVTGTIDLSALKNLKIIKGRLTVNDVPLTNFNALSNLEELGSLEVYANNLLTELPQLQNIKVLDELYLFNNPSLQDCSGISELTEIRQHASIEFTALKDLNFLKNIEKVGGLLSIKYNKQLVNINSLQKLSSVGIEMHIVSNPLLADCAIEIVCKLSKANKLLISENAGNCLNREQIANVCSALPVTLSTFKAFTENSTIRIQWTTLSEIYSSYFEIQQSTNGKNWHVIGRIPAKMNSDKKTLYEFTQNNPAPGNNYYRLKMIDQDNSFSFSRIIKVNFDGDSGSLVYPNPVSKTLYLRSGSQIKSVKIFNANGLFQGSPEITSTNTIPVDTMNEGIYVLKITRTDESTSTEKFQVKH